MTDFVEIPGESFAKQRPLFVRRTNSAITPKETREATKSLRWQFRALWKHPLIASGPILLQVDFIFECPVSWSKRKKGAMLYEWKDSKPDADNLIKLVKDGLNGIAWKDDAQVACVSVTKQYGPRAMTRIHVSPLSSKKGGAS